MAKITTTLGDQEIELGPLGSPTSAFEILSLGEQTSHLRTSAAALVACWRKPLTGRPKVSLQQHSYNAAKFGVACSDALLKQGFTPLQIVEAAAPALHLLQEEFIDGSNVKAAEDFSDPAEAD